MNNVKQYIINPWVFKTKGSTFGIKVRGMWSEIRLLELLFPTCSLRTGRRFGCERNFTGKNGSSFDTSWLIHQGDQKHFGAYLSVNHHAHWTDAECYLIPSIVNQPSQLAAFDSWIGKFELETKTGRRSSCIWGIISIPGLKNLNLKIAPSLS